MNSVRMTGTAVRQPELRYTPGGLAVLTVDIGGVQHLLSHEGEKIETTFYQRFTCFGGVAEVHANADVGTAFAVVGGLDYQSWQDGDKTRNDLRIKGLRVKRIAAGEVVFDRKKQPLLVGALNDVTIEGNLTRDADLRQTTNSSTNVSNFTVAVNERYPDKQGKEVEKVHYVDVTTWREVAEMTGTFKKGDPVFAFGRLVTNPWTDSEGKQGYSTKVEAANAYKIEYKTDSLKPSVAQVAAASKLEEEFPDEDLPF